MLALNGIPKPSYSGRHAELYDIFYSDKAYGAEAGFVDRCLQRFRPNSVHRVLELACGTGSHALALERHGYNIIATDYSEDMLRVARAKAAAVNSGVEFRLQDMAALDVPEAPFDAIVCLFDSIGYVASNEAVDRVLANVRKHLVPGGLFVFEFWHAAAMLRSYDPVRVRRWDLPGEQLIRISETSLQHEHALAHVNYSIYELHDTGTYGVVTEKQTNRYFQVPEMAHFLSRSDLVPVRWFNGFHWDGPITEDTWHVVGIATPR